MNAVLEMTDGIKIAIDMRIDVDPFPAMGAALAQGVAQPKRYILDRGALAWLDFAALRYHKVELETADPDGLPAFDGVPVCLDEDLEAAA
jgi:hypothetical protein